MKNQMLLCSLRSALLLLAFSTLHASRSTLFAQGTAFTYQGRLNVGGEATNGVYDFTFTLFGLSSGGSAVAGPVTNAAVGVTNGLFTTALDLGAKFPGADRWLEIGARSNGLGAFTTLSPRQKLTPTPYAIFAGTASNVPAGSIASSNLAPFNALGSTSACGQLDLYHTAVGGPGITLNGCNSQISTFGDDGLEQIRLWGPQWGE